MSKASIKALLAVSLLLGAAISWQTANEYYFQYQMNETTEAMKAYSSAVSLTYVLLTLSCITFIWSAVSAYFRE